MENRNQMNNRHKQEIARLKRNCNHIGSWHQTDLHIPTMSHQRQYEYVCNQCGHSEIQNEIK